MPDFPEIRPSDSFAALFLKRRHGITAETCFLLYEEKPDEFGAKRIEMLHCTSSAIFVQYFVVETRETNPEEIGRIERLEPGFAVASTSQRLLAKHFDEIAFAAGRDALHVSVKGTKAFSLSSDGPTAERVAHLRERVRTLLRPPQPAQVLHPDVERIQKGPTILVDGANVARMPTMWGAQSGKGFGRIQPLATVKQALLRKGYFPLIIYDASLRTDRTMDVPLLDGDVAPIPPHAKTPTTLEADDFILGVAETHDPAKRYDKWFILSGDFFRTRAAKYPTVDLNRRLVEVTWNGPTPLFTVAGDPNFHHVRNPKAVPREMLPPGGPAIR